MLRPMPQTHPSSQIFRLARIGLFAAITALAAKISIELGGPVPFTLQTLAVLMTGMLLGARDGALSQLLYVGVIAIGLPLDARGLGAAAFSARQVAI